MERMYDIISVGIAYGDYAVDHVGQPRLEETLKNLSSSGYTVIAIYDTTDNKLNEIKEK